MNARCSIVLLVLLGLWLHEGDVHWLLASICFVLWLLLTRFENSLWLRATKGKHGTP